MTMTQDWQGQIDRLVARAFEELEGESARDFSTEKRKSMAKEGTAMPDGSFPIANKEDLNNARRAIGRAPASKRAAVKAHIRKRAKALGVDLSDD